MAQLYISKDGLSKTNLHVFEAKKGLRATRGLTKEGCATGCNVQPGRF